MKKKKVKKYVIIATLIIVLGILSFVMYQSYAYFKVNYTGNMINATVGHFGSYEYVYTGSVQEFVVPSDGYYEVELWGAQGSLTNGGLGGYTSGKIYLTKNEKLYIYVGQDSQVSNMPGWNGGGYSSIALSPRGAGGGATDIRLINGSWNDSASLRSRIMVAGAGGGGITDVYNASGGLGGSLIGGTGNKIGTETTVTLNSGGGQTSGGKGGTGAIYSGVVGLFGQGGYPNSQWTAGGGGGYYGGGSSSISTSTVVSGAGGSSYISGYSGVNSIQESGGTTAQPLHTNNTLHYSGKYFLNGSMKAGVNQGNGSAKITYVGQVERSNTNLDNVRYIKSCTNGNSVNIFNHWAEIQAIKDGINVAKGKTVTGTGATAATRPFTYVTDGDVNTNTDSNTGAGATTRLNQCVTVDLGAVYDLDEVALWMLYFGDGRKYNDNVLSVGTTNTSGTTSLTTILHSYPGTTGYTETSQGKRYTAWD